MKNESRRNKQGAAIKHAILLLRKTLHMIRFPPGSLDEAEELQGGDRSSKPSSEFPLRISYCVMKCEITRANYSNRDVYISSFA